MLLIMAPGLRHSIGAQGSDGVPLHLRRLTLRLALPEIPIGRAGASSGCATAGAGGSGRAADRRGRHLDHDACSCAGPEIGRAGAG